jgi:hypothetical protein
MLKVIECRQGSPEWIAARAGAITASNFLMIRSKVGMLTEQQQDYVTNIRLGYEPKYAAEKAGYKSPPSAEAVKKALRGEPVGDWSDAAKNYAFRLACERINGGPLEDAQFETYAMRRGRELEEQCRIRHESEIGQFVDLAGFVVTEDGKFGASADSLIGADGGAEYKCFYAPEKVRPILTENDWGDVMDQVQGCLWLTGRKWWDMCLYFPALASIGKDFTRRRVMRDDNYIEQLEADLVEFDRLVCEWVERLKAKPESEMRALMPVEKAA